MGTVPDADHLATALAPLGVHGPVPLTAEDPVRRWVARDATGGRVRIGLVDVRDDARARRLADRVDALVRLRDDAVARVRGAVDVGPGWRAVLHDEVPGPDLLALLAGRDGWRAAEVAGLVADVAAGLDALHRAGVVHGDVSPGNVVVTPEGRGVLVDLLEGAEPGEAGTPSVAAPERVDGATAAADVHALAVVAGRLLDLCRARERCAQGRCPRAEGAGQDVTRDGGPCGPCVEDAAHAGRLRELLSRARAADPAARPTAGELAGLVTHAGPAASVRVPEPAVLARAAFARGAVDPDEATRRRPPVRRGRHRRRRDLRPVVASAVCALVLGGGLVALRLLVPDVGAPAGPASASGEPTDPRVGGGPAAGGRDARAVTAASPTYVATAAPPHVTAAVHLTHLRARALAEGELLALLGVTAPGSPAAGADLARYGAEGAARGGTVDVRVHAALAVRGCPDAVAVDATAVLRDAPGDEDTGPDAPDVDPGAGPEAAAGRRVVLVLGHDAGAWRVRDVLGPDQPCG